MGSILEVTNISFFKNRPWESQIILWQSAKCLVWKIGRNCHERTCWLHILQKASDKVLHQSLLSTFGCHVDPLKKQKKSSNKWPIGVSVHFAKIKTTTLRKRTMFIAMFTGCLLYKEEGLWTVGKQIFLQKIEGHKAGIPEFWFADQFGKAGKILICVLGVSTVVHYWAKWSLSGGQQSQGSPLWRDGMLRSSTDRGWKVNLGFF